MSHHTTFIMLHILGIDVSPGYSTLIALSGKETIRLPAPYSDCVNSDAELQLLREAVAKSTGNPYEV